MERAAVLIGVNTTGQLPVLNAAVDGAKKMAEWADKQSIPAGRICLLTDESSPVTVARIKQKIAELAALCTVEQLIIYFSGHGMYTRGSEFWLLTNAPGDADEAVNVADSQDDARIGVFKHVVFISDACRTPAVGLQFQRVRGSSIFPSPAQPANPERSVDLFFACGFGTASNETAVPARAATWRSIYTETLYGALTGDFPFILDSEIINGADVALVKTQRLKPFLTAEVPRSIINAGLGPNALQTPDARVCSDASAWVSLLCPPPPGIPTGGILKTANLKPQTDASKAANAVARALGDPSVDALELLPRPEIRLTDSLEPSPTAFQKRFTVPTLAQVARRIYRADTGAPQSFETGCGFLVDGATLADARVLGPDALLHEKSDDAAKIAIQTTATNVLLTFADGRGTVLPAIRNFIATLTFQQDVLYSVSWQKVGDVEDPTLQSLRALVASMSHQGAFHLDIGAAGGQGNAQRLANRIRGGKTADPSMAVYAAYAFYDLQFIDHIRDMADFLADSLGFALFDLSLLTRSLGLPHRPGQPRLLPFFPLLTRGWSLLPRTLLPPNLSDLYAHLSPSQWSLFDPEGVALIQAALSANNEVL